MERRPAIRCGDDEMQSRGPTKTARRRYASPAEESSSSGVTYDNLEGFYSPDEVPHPAVLDPSILDLKSWKDGPLPLGLKLSWEGKLQLVQQFSGRPRSYYFRGGVGCSSSTVADHPDSPKCKGIDLELKLAPPDNR